MTRTERQLKEEQKRTGSVSHSGSCGYPSEPCSCEVHNKREVRTTHKSYCNYPSDPCDCGLLKGV